MFQIELEMKLLIFLWFLSTRATYREISVTFDISESTCCTIVHKLGETFTKYLVPKCIKWPTAEEADAIAQTIEDITGFSGVIGMIDGCHIPVKSPQDSGEEYVNRNNYTSIILQGAYSPKNTFLAHHVNDIYFVLQHIYISLKNTLHCFRCMQRRQAIY